MVVTSKKSIFNPVKKYYVTKLQHMCQYITRLIGLSEGKGSDKPKSTKNERNFLKIAVVFRAFRANSKDFFLA